MNVLGFIGILIVIVVLVAFTNIMIYEDHAALSVVLLIVATIGLIFIAACILYTPTALDVYRGKTELRITYDGKIPVDSVVIYKKGGEQ